MTMIDPDKYLDLVIDYKLLEKEYAKLATVAASLMEEGAGGILPDGIYIEIEELPEVRKGKDNNGNGVYETDDFHLTDIGDFQKFLEVEIQSVINDVAQLLAIKEAAFGNPSD